MLRVGIYARVSTEEEKQKKAFDRQIEQLTDFVNSQSEWTLQEIYFDKGYSGTEVSRRKGYNRMIKDIEAKKLDLIVIKDESRLNRNTYEGLKFLKILVENKVKLYFHLESKYHDPMNDLDIKVKLMLAEEHSKNLSKNINDAQKKRQLKGRIITNGTMWGYEQSDGELIVKEDEAEVVRKVFEMYASGKGFRQIMVELKDFIPDEIKIRRGIDTLPLTTLKRMIRNEKYKGDVVGNKLHKDFFTKEIVENSKEEWIIVEDACPPIVSKELWEKANEQLKRKQKKLDIEGKKKIAGYFNGTYFLSGKIKCGLCGAPFWHSKAYSKLISNVWQCGTYKSYGRKKGCSAPTVPTDLLRGKLQNVIFEFMKDKDQALDNVIKVLKIALEEPKKNENELKTLKSKLKNESIKKDKLQDAFLLGVMTADEVIEKKAQIVNEINRLEDRIKELEGEAKIILTRIEKLNMVRESFNIEFEKPENISDELITEIVEEVVIFSKDKINITLIGDVSFESIENPQKNKLPRGSDMLQ